MANGDKAAAVGWTIYPSTQDRRMGYDNDNYALDRAAEQFVTLRDIVLPAINQPVFAVKRATASPIVKASVWTPATGGWWSGPRLNSGFTRWSGGQLTIKTGGVYRVAAHVQFDSTQQFASVGAQLVKNTLDPNTSAGTLAKNVMTNNSSADVHDLVSLVPGDVVTLLVRQANAGGADRRTDEDAFDLTMSLEWVRA